MNIITRVNAFKRVPSSFSYHYTNVPSDDAETTFLRSTETSEEQIKELRKIITEQ